MAQTDIPQKTKIIMTIAALFMPVFLILPFFFWGGEDDSITIDKELQASRLAPVGQLTVGKPAGDTAVAAVDSAPAFDAAGTYKTVCSACHDNLPNAPKPSDTAAWQARLDKAGSLDALVKSGIQGTAGGMPPKGGSALDDGQFHDMVVYMLDHAKVAHGAAPAPADNAAAPAPADSAAAPADNAAAPTPADSAPAVAAAPAFDAAGTYKASCAACHDNLPNAPKPSDTAAWQARLDKAGSLDALVKNGIQGTAGGMPPKGGSALDDAQFHDMVVYMLDHAKVAHGAAPVATPAPADNAAAPADSAAAPVDNAAAPAPADSAPAVAAAPAFDAAGTYKASCAACHDNLPNAPKPSDTAAWQARLDKAGSLDALVKNGIQGTAGGMPPKGGSALDDAQFHDVVVYLLENANIPQGGSGAAAPAAGDSSAAAPATEAKTEAPAVADNSAAAPAAEAKTEVAAAGGASAPRDPNFNPQGEYDKLCATCHAIGLMNAPKLGDSAAWKERLDKAGGLDGLVQQGIKGINAMPPKGGSTVNDDQFHDLVVFFLDKSDVAH